MWWWQTQRAARLQGGPPKGRTTNLARSFVAVTWYSTHAPHNPIMAFRSNPVRQIGSRYDVHNAKSLSEWVSHH